MRETREHYVRPPLFAREPRPAWIAVWRFRLVALIVLCLAVLVAVLLFRVVTGATAQDPGIGAQHRTGVGAAWPG